MFPSVYSSNFFMFLLLFYDTSVTVSVYSHTGGLGVMGQEVYAVLYHNLYPP